MRRFPLTVTWETYLRLQEGGGGGWKPDATDPVPLSLSSDSADIIGYDSDQTALSCPRAIHPLFEFSKRIYIYIVIELKHIDVNGKSVSIGEGLMVRADGSLAFLASDKATFFHLLRLFFFNHILTTSHLFYLITSNARANKKKAN